MLQYDSIILIAEKLPRRTLPLVQHKGTVSLTSCITGKVTHEYAVFESSPIQTIGMRNFFLGTMSSHNIVFLVSNVSKDDRLFLRKDFKFKIYITVNYAENFTSRPRI